MSSCQAQLLVRVATAQSEEVWIAHARQTTVRFLKEDVERAERMREADPQTFARTFGLPQGQEAQLRAKADDVQTCAQRKRIEPVAPLPVPKFREELKRILDELRGKGSPFDDRRRKVAIRFWMPAALEPQWQQACELAGMADPALVIEMVLDAFLAAWGEEALGSIRRHPILERDACRCAVPTCGRRAKLQVHHIVFRCEGGTNERSLLISLCAIHHLHGVHEGYIRIGGRAPDDLVWELGLRPEGKALLVVVGRRVERWACDRPAGGSHPLQADDAIHLDTDEMIGCLLARDSSAA